MDAVRKHAFARWEPEMHALFAAGRYGEAAALYDRHSDPSAEASLLRSRIYLGTDFSRGLALLNALRVASHSPLDVRRRALLGEAYALSGDYEAADAHLDDALASARALRDGELVAETGYRMARRYVMAGDHAGALAALAIAREGRSLDSRLNALHAESAVFMNDPTAKWGTRSLVELLRLIDPAGTEHVHHRAAATHTLAVRARELYLPDVVAEVERQLQGSPWPDDFAHNRFQALKALGWTRALQGDYFNAFRFLKECTRSAPTDAWRTMALCDRAYLATSIGEHRWARQELLEAEEISQRVAWEGCKDEESVALLLLAELYAPIDAAQASAYVARFHRAGEVKNARNLLKDERRRALVDFSSGVVDMALGNRKLAVSRLTASLRVYREVGFQWRAGRCALRLFDVTRKREHLSAAEELLRNYSPSWLGDELRARRAPQTGAVVLSPMRERVFKLLCEGRSNEEIAAIVGRSKATVANHAKAVLKCYGVSSRSALLAQAHKRGVV